MHFRWWSNLVADSSQATGLKWATAAGGGKVLQVVSATYSTETSVTGSTWTDSGLSLSITPSASTSRILVMISQLIYAERSSDNAGVGLRLLRGATTVMTVSNSYATYVNIASGSTPQSGGTGVIVYVDSPATTSSTTYKTQFQASFSSVTAKAQIASGTSTITLLEIGA